ncbi:MAG: alpha-L-fucosidase [Clostridia bacterium]|nr:alpha-L-fucosidase [Clostridia bacterium]
MNFNEFLYNVSRVKPSEKQLRHLRETPFYAFVHFSPNTYTDLEWGDGTEDPAIFNPRELDCEQWVKAIKSAGMKGLVLTAKHHDGFCLWQTEYTEHSIKNSPYKNGKGDIVKEAADACKKHGIKFGFYLSPWDRNSKYYGTDEYNTYYKNQLTELLTNYGEIFYVWFDGACGEGPNGKKQVYDFDGYVELIEKYQPNATIFHDTGIIRWCGNEAGAAPYAQWAVVPMELCSMNKPQTRGALVDGDLSFNYNSDIGIGSLETIIYSKGLVFAPAETDMSIRPGWFYHENEKPHSLDRLFKTYLNSVGNNTTFNLNIPPMPNGKFNDEDVTRLKELGELIEKEFGTNLAEGIPFQKLNGCGKTQPEYIVTLTKKKTIKYVELAEKISEGQRISSFAVLTKDEHAQWRQIAQSTTVGSRKIIKINPTETDEIKIRIMSSRDTPEIEWIKIY